MIDHRRGGGSPRRQIWEDSRRGRMLGLFASEAYEHGYGRMTIAGMLTRAGLSKSAFYREFKDKEECLVCVGEGTAEWLLGRIAAAMSERDERDRADAFVAATVRAVADAPAACWCYYVELSGAGSRAAHCKQDLARRLEATFVPTMARSPVLRRVVLGGIDAAVEEALVTGDIASLIESQHALADFVRRGYRLVV